MGSDMRAIHSLADYLVKNAQLDIEDDGSGTPDLVRPQRAGSAHLLVGRRPNLSAIKEIEQGCANYS